MRSKTTYINRVKAWKFQPISSAHNDELGFLDHHLQPNCPILVDKSDQEFKHD